MTRNCETKRGEGAGKIRQLQNICCRRTYTKNTPRMETHNYPSKKKKRTQKRDTKISRKKEVTEDGK